MPLACDPTQTFDTWLRVDADKPEGDRPTFTFRYLTGREFMRISGIMDSLKNQESLEAAYNAVMGCLVPNLAGWRNIPDPQKPKATVPYTVPDAIDTVLTQREMTELVYAMLHGARPSGEDRGKSEAQP